MNARAGDKSDFWIKLSVIGATTLVILTLGLNLINVVSADGDRDAKIETNRVAIENVEEDQDKLTNAVADLIKVTGDLKTEVKVLQALMPPKKNCTGPDC